jgi:hypothetical protein
MSFARAACRRLSPRFGLLALALLALPSLGSLGAMVTLPLSAIMPDSAHQDWGSLQLNKAVAATPLSIAGRTFAHGLGTHARSEIVYTLDGEYQHLHAWVGVDDNLKQHPEAPKASVVFQVLGDRKVLFDSGVMRMGDPAKEVNVPVKEVAELVLVVGDGGDGITCDHADWAEAVLISNETPAAPAEPQHRVRAPGFTLLLDKQGGIAGALVGDKQESWPLTGGTWLRGFRPTTAPTVSQDGRVFTRRLADARGHSCTVTERFTPEAEGIKWEIELTSPDDAFWTAPIVSRLKCGSPEQRLIWTAWGSPDFSGTQLSPELAARVQAGKASVGGDWSDPLVPVGFLSRSWHYGNVTQNCPVGSDYIALPLLTVMDPVSDTGLSLVLSPADVLLDVTLSVSAAGQYQFARSHHRLGGGRTARFTAHLVPHEASWRGGLRFLTARYPQFFDPPNPRAHQLAGCGAYSTGELPIDTDKFRKMAFGFNWKLSDDFPYMGMFIPPVQSADATWIRSCDERSADYKGRESSCRQMNNYAHYMRTNGFAVLSYFNVTEFGKNMYGRQPLAQADDPALWQDPVAYLKFKLPDAVFDPGIHTCYNAYIVDPGDPAYLEFILQQAARNTALLPATDGICIDRADWLRLYNRKADDGVSWLDGQPARSLFRSWAMLMSRLGPQMHKADKVIFCNLMTERLELCRELDGIYTEFGNNGNALNAAALLCLRKPAVCWTCNETLRQPHPDAFMQRHLYLGCFPTAPYPYNNHCITPEPAADQLYLDYGLLLDAMRGKKWVLTPHCLESDSAKVNLFEVPGGYVLPVTFAGKADIVTVRVRNLPGLKNARCEALHPGIEQAVPLPGKLTDGALELTVPVVRGCALVKISRRSNT